MNPRISKCRYYALSFTWGLLSTTAGLIVALCLLITGHKPHRWGYAWYFEVGNRWGGASLGPVFIKDRTDSEHIKNHEFGHSIQNCYFGLFMPILVSIPSSLRFHTRNIMRLFGKRPKTPYDSVWFERQATELGTEFTTWQRGQNNGEKH